VKPHRTHIGLISMPGMLPDTMTGHTIIGLTLTATTDITAIALTDTARTIAPASRSGGDLAADAGDNSRPLK